MSIVPIMPISLPGSTTSVSWDNLRQPFDDLVRILNERFRQVDQSTPAGASASGGFVTSAKIWKAKYSDQPTPNLGVQDEGFLWYVSDYAHLLRWTGRGWEFVDGCGNYIVGFTAAPTGPGYQICNGAATHYLKIAAGVVSEAAFTTPNLTGSPAYQKWAAAYSGPGITAANAASISSAGNAASGSTSPAFIRALSADAEPAHLSLLPYFRR